mmetsp:Transcript_13430/g.49943  ORF Transcript_13430/g.49943 Transcript_13430/m.49943 type:complete len:324 (+) Transcript_13430:274-1245(+)
MRAACVSILSKVMQLSCLVNSTALHIARTPTLTRSSERFWLRELFVPLLWEDERRGPDARSARDGLHSSAIRSMFRMAVQPKRRRWKPICVRCTSNSKRTTRSSLPKWGPLRSPNLSLTDATRDMVSFAASIASLTRLPRSEFSCSGPAEVPFWLEAEDFALPTLLCDWLDCTPLAAVVERFLRRGRASPFWMPMTRSAILQITNIDLSNSDTIASSLMGRRMQLCGASSKLRTKPVKAEPSRTQAASTFEMFMSTSAWPKEYSNWPKTSLAKACRGLEISSTGPACSTSLAIPSCNASAHSTKDPAEANPRGAALPFMSSRS